jgi:hypothetical protein
MSCGFGSDDTSDFGANDLLAANFAGVTPRPCLFYPLPNIKLIGLLHGVRAGNPELDSISARLVKVGVSFG